MIDLTQSATASPLVHAVTCDPGTSWASESIAIDAPPDGDIDPAPDARWPADAVRTGLCGAVSPRIVALPAGGYRMYYTQILPRIGFPKGANDYDNATSRILSATSADGVKWNPEPGVRLSPQQGGAGDFRVVRPRSFRWLTAVGGSGCTTNAAPAHSRNGTQSAAPLQTTA